MKKDELDLTIYASEDKPFAVTSDLHYGKLSVFFEYIANDYRCELTESLDYDLAQTHLSDEFKTSLVIGGAMIFFASIADRDAFIEAISSFIVKQLKPIALPVNMRTNIKLYEDGKYLIDDNNFRTFDRASKHVANKLIASGDVVFNGSGGNEAYFSNVSETSSIAAQSNEVDLY